MAIARVGAQVAGASGSTTVDVVFPGNVTSGNLVVFTAVSWRDDTNDPFLAGDATLKSGSTATLGTITLDKGGTYNYQDTYWLAVAIWSAPVTGTGSCTITVAGVPAGGSITAVVREYSGTDVGASRLEDSDYGTGDGTVPATPSVTSAGEALFFGAVSTSASGAQTHTPGADYTEVYEEENGSLYATGSVEDRIVISGTTDTADWIAPDTLAWAAAVAVYKVASDGGTRNPVAMGFVLE